MNGLWQDFRMAVRLLRRAPGTSLAAAASIGLAIGANTAIFSLVNAVFLTPLSVPDADRLMAVYRSFAPGASAGTFTEGLLPTSYPNYRDFRDRSRTLASLAAYTVGQFNLSGDGEPEPVLGEFVTDSYFEAVGVPPARGRFFRPEEVSDEAAAAVAVLAHGLWQRRFAGDPRVVGSSIRLNGRPYTIVGVAPPQFAGLSTLFATELWVPVGNIPQLTTGAFAEALDRREYRFFLMFGRLAPGVEVPQAQAEMDAIARRLAEEHPEINRQRGIRVLPAAEATLDPNQRQLYIRAGGLLMGAVGLVLLVACANVASLLMARAAARRREIAVRLALGATRRTLFREALAESLLLAGAGAAAGTILALWIRDVLWTLRPPFLTDAALSLALDLRVLAFTIAVTLATALLLALGPLWTGTRLDLVKDLRDRGPAGRARASDPRRLLVAAQAALCFAALAGAGLFVRSLANARTIDPGFAVASLGVMTIDPASGAESPEVARRLLDRVVARVSALPGVEATGVATTAPLSPGPAWRIFVDGAEDIIGPAGQYVSRSAVSAAYFETLGIRLIEGRAFDSRDGVDGRPVAIINRTMAGRFWPGERAVGRQFRLAPPINTPYEIVGVVEDAKYVSLGERPQPFLYTSLEQEPPGPVVLHLRTPRGPDAVLELARRELRALDADLPVSNVNAVGDLLAQALWAPRMGALLLGSFALVALTLALTGIYGVVAQILQERRREIGVRLALGADRARIAAFVLRSGVAPVAIGILPGAAAAAVASGAVQALLYDVPPLSPGAFGGAAILLLAAATAACLGPSLRAARTDPLETLKSE